MGEKKKKKKEEEQEDVCSSLSNLIFNFRRLGTYMIKSDTQSQTMSKFGEKLRLS